MKEGRDFSVCNFVKGPFKKIIFFYTGQVGMMMSLWRQKYKFAHRFTRSMGGSNFQSQGGKFIEKNSLALHGHGTPGFHPTILLFVKKNMTHEPLVKVRRISKVR